MPTIEISNALFGGASNARRQDAGATEKQNPHPLNGTKGCGTRVCQVTAANWPY
jgi:hypothetical protein